jgi:hypothetical protein
MYTMPEQLFDSAESPPFMECERGTHRRIALGSGPDGANRPLMWP